MPWSQDLYQRGLRFAAQAHQGQSLPGTDLSYVVHLSWVASEVMAALAREAFDQPDLAVACALLHDAVEDTQFSVEDVAREFGSEVAAGVAALTKDAKLAKAERMPDSLRRIQAQPREVWAVKLGDRISNLQQPPKHWSVDKCQAYASEAETILAELGSASPWLSSRLQQKIAEYRRILPG